MTASAQPASLERYDVRTILRGAVVLGVITAMGVVVFALLGRVMQGVAETVVRSVLILAGGAVFGYFPAATVRPRTADTIAWAATLGFLGSVVFAVIDTAALRPLSVYHWTWDQLGGGSGFWYISVWWMGSAVLAWLGSWAYARAARRTGVANFPALVTLTVMLAVLFFAALVGTGIFPVHSAVMALAVALALVTQVAFAPMLARR